MAYLLMFTAAITGLFEGILIKQYNKKHHKGGFVFTAIVSLFSMIFFFLKDIILDPTGLKFPKEIVIYAVIAGVLYCTASICTYLALQSGSFAITMLVLSYSLVISVIYGLIFLEEKSSVFTYISFAVIAVSIFLIKGKGSPDEPKKKFSVKWLIYMLLSVFGNGLLTVVMVMQRQEAQRAYGEGASFDNEFMIICLSISALILFVIGFIKDGEDTLYILKHGVPFAAAAGLSNGATNMLGLILNGMINEYPLSISVPTRSIIKTLVSFLVSLFIFKEHFEKKQILGIILGTAAVILLNLGI